MIKVCDICRMRCIQFSVLRLRIKMPSTSILKVILLITFYTQNTLSYPVKSEIPEFGDWLSKKIKPIAPISPKSRFAAMFDSKSILPPIAEIAQDPNDDPEPLPKTGCGNEISKILFPLKYRIDDGLLEPMRDNKVNVLKLPLVKSPYDNYKVLIAAAPSGLELGDDNDKPMAVYIVFNDDRSYPSPMNLPTVYFVKKRTMTHGSVKDVNPILLIDSNRTVTGLRSKEIQKFVKFTNKLTGRANDIMDSTKNRLNFRS